jgi:hypothetical protein
MEVFLSGIANGLEAANIKLISENLKPIFCCPIELNFGDINDALEKEYSARNIDWKPDSTGRSVLLVGLHVFLAYGSRWRGNFIAYGVLHCAIFLVVWIWCLTMISKDSL